MKIKKYFKDYLNNFQPNKKWTYETACVLLGCIQLYEASSESFYKEFVENYIQSCIDKDGNILVEYNPEDYNLENIKMASVFLYLYEKTLENKYLNVVETLLAQLADQPRTKSNNFCYKKTHPNQIRLDSLYMAMPFYISYETTYNNKENYLDIFKQYNNVRKYLFDEEKQLYYHDYDGATGLVKEFSLSSMGLYMLSLIDVMDEMSIEIFEQFKGYEKLLKEALSGILQYQDKDSKLFYQFTDRPKTKGNQLEASGSAMVAYVILKGCRLGILHEEKYRYIGEAILDSLIENKIKESDKQANLQEVFVGVLMMAYGESLTLQEESI